MKSNQKRNKNNEKLKKKYKNFFEIFDDIKTIYEKYHSNSFDKKIIENNRK